MKLSEMSTDKFTEALAIITPAIGNIVNDTKVVTTFETVAKRFSAKERKITEILDALIGFIPQLLPKHKKDLYAIVAIMSDKTVAEVGAQPITVTMQDIRDLLDADMQSFFADAASMEPTA